MALELMQDIPGYKAILKSVLKAQIQLLVEQLCDQAGEESIILTASLNDGSLSHMGSKMGKRFFEEKDEIKSQFLGYCLKNKSDTNTTNEEDNSLDCDLEEFSSNQKLGLESDIQDTNRQTPQKPVTLPLIMTVGEGSRIRKSKKKRKLSASDQPASNSNLSVTAPDPQNQTKDLCNEDKHLKGDRNTGSSSEQFDSLKSPSLNSNIELLNGNNQDSRIKIEAGTDGGQDIKQNDIDAIMKNLGMEEGFGLKGHEVADTNGYQDLKEDVETLNKDADWGERQIYQCERCGVKFERKPALTKHIRDHHNEYKCQICGKIEKRRYNLKNHMEVVHEGRCWICEVCGSSFKSNGGLSSHMKVQHSDMLTKKALYSCEKCSKNFIDKNIYLGHISKHEGTKLFSCIFCLKQYQYKNNLKAHVCAHVTKQTPKCDQCGACFSTNKELKAHFSGIHLKIEKYRCACGKAFRWSSSLAFHRNKCAAMWQK